jgi:hypothetical protein
MRHSSSGKYVIGISGREVNVIFDRVLTSSVREEGTRRSHRIITAEIFAPLYSFPSTFHSIWNSLETDTF